VVGFWEDLGPGQEFQDLTISQVCQDPSTRLLGSNGQL
jgi:hypothetical protein